MYVPAWPGLAPVDLIRPALRQAQGVAASRAQPFPFSAPEQLRFYRARNAIYHLFRHLPPKGDRLVVIAPDYYSGNEVLAIRAAGATIHYARVDRRMQLDPADVERLCEQHRPDVLFVIHYLGWPQPIRELAAICRRHGVVLVEDCALSLLSEDNGRRLGSFGDYAIFCLYKTVPVPNGALLVANPSTGSGQVASAGSRSAEAIALLEQTPQRPAGSRSVVGRIAELMALRLRSRAGAIGAAVHAAKRGIGRAAGAMRISHSPVGDIGFDINAIDLAMSGVSDRLLHRLDFDAIRERRIRNFEQLDQEIDGQATRVRAGVAGGVCPLSFPIFVADKHAAARALERRGIEAIEMWNDDVAVNHDGSAGSRAMSDDVRFLRAHVLELPVHQDLTPRHISYIADQVRILQLRLA
jgi:hypothetical protein